MSKNMCISCKEQYNKKDMAQDNFCIYCASEDALFDKFVLPEFKFTDEAREEVNKYLKKYHSIIFQLEDIEFRYNCQVPEESPEFLLDVDDATKVIETIVDDKDVWKAIWIAADKAVLKIRGNDLNISDKDKN
jgi:ribosome-associated translation inhibitor RaiA